jgi:hypothetical protein
MRKKKTTISQRIREWDGSTKLSPRDYAIAMKLFKHSKAKEAEILKKQRLSCLKPPPVGIVVVRKEPRF